ncbi:ROK family protein [Deinococcus koreensis]|uniref:ROK family protein n=1 Tax=Deinococcus koreensis TaxID=2054903 RepID=UPI0013FE44DF|nr:ROK family protein [Deinococcus koreensis]
MTEAQGRAGNRERVWRQVLSHGLSSRADVAEGLRLSKVAVTNIAAELIEAGWLTEAGLAGGYAGRPAGLLDLHPQAGTVLGVDVQRRVVTATLGDLRGDPGAVQALPLPVPDEVTGTVLELLRAAHARPPHGPLRQVVISVPAPVGPQGEPEAPSGLPEFGAAAAQDWASAHEVPLAFENDVKLAAVAEHHAGAALGRDDFALLALRETGVALGLFLGGRLYRGDRGRAGELSLLRWPDAGRLTPLESLDPQTRQAALAMIVGGLAAALDLRLLVVQGGPDTAEELIGQIRALVSGSVSIAHSAHGDAGPLRGALVLAARLAQDGVLRAGLPAATPREARLNPSG